MDKQFTPGQRVIWQAHSIVEEEHDDKQVTVRTPAGRMVVDKSSLTPAESLPVQGEPVAALLRRIDAYLQGKSAETRAIIKDSAAFLRALPPAQPVQVPEGLEHMAHHPSTPMEAEFNATYLALCDRSITNREIARRCWKTAALLAASQPAAQQFSHWTEALAEDMQASGDAPAAQSQEGGA